MAQAPILSGFADQAGTGPRTRVGAMDGKQGLQALSAIGTLRTFTSTAKPPQTLNPPWRAP
jgi:hypothetical protein